MNFKKVKLGEICEIVSGATPSTTVKEYWDSEFYWATPKDLSNLNVDTIDKTSRMISKKGLDSCAATLLPKNSILLSSRAPIGLVAINNVPMATNQGFKNLIPNKELVDTKFLFHWLKANRRRIDAMGVGATFKEVSKAIVSKIDLVLPSLAEQKRIAELIDTTDQIKRLREQAIAKLDYLAQSVFVDMFGDPVSNPKNLKKEKLTEFFKFKTGKLDSNASVENGKYPFFTCAKENFSIDEFAFDEEALLLAGNNASGDYSVKHYVGKFNAYQRTYVINLASAECTYEYAKTGLEFMLGKLKRMSKGTNTKYLTMGMFGEMTILVPPKVLQEQYGIKIKNIEKLKAKEIDGLESIKKLQSSLQHQSFAVN